MFRFGSSTNGNNKNAEATRGDATPPTPSSPVLTVSIPAIDDEDESSRPASTTRASFTLPPPNLWDANAPTDPYMSTTTTTITIGSSSSSPSSSSPFSSSSSSSLSTSPKGSAYSEGGSAKKKQQQQQNQQQQQRQEPQHRQVQLVEAGQTTRGLSRGGDRSKISIGGAATRTFSTFRGSTPTSSSTLTMSGAGGVGGVGGVGGSGGGPSTASSGSAAATPTPSWVRSPPAAQAISPPAVPSSTTQIIPSATAGFAHKTTGATSSAGHMGTPSTNLAPPPNNNNSLSITLSSAANFTAPHHPPTPEPHSFHQGQQKQQQQKQKQKQRQYHHQDDDPNIWKQQDHHYSSRVQRQESTGGGGSWLSVFSGSATKERSLSSSPSISPDSDTEILFDSRGEDDTMNDLEEDERKYGQPVHRTFARFPRRRSSSASSLDTFTTATKRQQRRRGGAGGLRSTGNGWFTRLQKRYFIWKRQRRRLYSLIRLVVLALLSAAVVFTTLELLLGFDFDGDDGPLRTGGGGGMDRAKAHFKSFDYNLRELRLRRKQSTKRRSPSVFDVQAQNYTRHFWELPIQDHLGGGSSIDINEDYMLSKAFAGAMQPTRVIPFYFRASERFPKKMVTITTLITPDRFQVFCRLVHQYQGPISVATHIRLDENPDEQFRILNELWATHAELGRFVDLHVVVDKIDFQLNMWRNIGRLFARTDYFMMLDVDFHIPSGFKRRLHEDKRIQELLEQGAALVVPAFEYSAETDPKDSFYFPDTKRDLVNLHEKGYIRVFHDFFPPGHNATDYSTWFGLSGVQFKGFFNSKNQPIAPALPPMSPPVRIENGRLVPIPDDQQEPYKITTFQPKYEPYIIVKREGTPWCDERFVGYGGNKAACLFEIYASGIDFYVMPQDFLIHQFHDYRDNDRKNGRILNRQIFINFQQESCFKYLETMILTGEWYTPKANNLREQCEVFDGFLKTADALAREYEAKHPNSLLRHRVFVPDDNNLKAHQQQQQQQQQQQGGNGDDRRLPPHHPIGNRYGEGSGSGGGGGSAASSEDDGLFYHLLHGTIGLQGGKVWGGITPKTYYTDPEAAMLPPSAASSSSSSFSSSNSSPQQGQKPAATAAAVAGGGNIDVDGEPIAPSEEDAKEDRRPATNAQAEEVVPKDTHVDQDHLDAFRAGHLVPGAVPFSFHRDRDEEPGGTAAGEDRVAEEGAEKKVVVEDGERGDGSTQSVQVQQQQQQQGNNEVAKEAEDPNLYHHKWTPPIPNMDRSPAQSKMAGADNNAVSNDQQSFEQAAEKMEDSVLEMLRSKPDTVK